MEEKFFSLFSSWSHHRLYWPLGDSPSLLCVELLLTSLQPVTGHDTLHGLQLFLGESGLTVLLSAQAVWGLLQACLALGAGAVLQPRDSDQRRPEQDSWPGLHSLRAQGLN